MTCHPRIVQHGYAVSRTPRRRFALFAVWALLGLLVPCETFSDIAIAADVGAESDDEDEDALPPLGLIATYTAVGETGPRVKRLEGTASILLTESESPDPRLAARNWVARWSGQLQVLQPGKYRFSTIVGGRVMMRVGGTLVLDASTTTPEDVFGDEVELSFGLHELSIEYVPSDNLARLRLMWECDEFAKEPIPAAAFSHRQDQWSEAPTEGWLSSFAQGQLLAEEHGCVACHQASDQAPLTHSLSHREGPRLKQGSPRLKAAWIYGWLANPREFRPEAVMPRLFSDDAIGNAERYALAVYLGAADGSDESRGNSPVAEKVVLGQQLFERIGCSVCHEKQGNRPPRATLTKLAQKTTREQLARFIEAPLEIDPSGRMPNMFVSKDEANRLSHFLMSRTSDEPHDVELPTPPTAASLHAAFLKTDPSSEAVQAFDSMSSNDRTTALAQATLRHRQCINCHEVRDSSGTIASHPRMANNDLGVVAQAVHNNATPRGCLADQTSPGQGTVNYPDELRNSEALHAFLSGLHKTTKAPSPGHAGILTLARFQCMRCHEFNGQGGLSPEFAAKMLAEQTETAAELIHPPMLTGVVNKLLASQLRATLVEGARARPWMDLRMPGFSKAAMSAMPSLLSTLEGDALVEENKQQDVDDALVDAGLTLVGSQGFGCTKCHDIGGRAGTGTRGPDLANVTRRVGYDWYLRWMTDPQRMQPGTRMPTVFFQGESPYHDVLGGDPQRQREAMWQFLLVAAERPIAELMPEASTKESLAATSVPQVMRTFLPDVSPRSMAIRYPNGVHLAYDAQACRLAYAWQGDFLDLTPVWTERGGHPAGIKGEVFWRSPPGFPWSITPVDADPPDFSNRAQDTSFGAMVPDDKQLHPRRLDFVGYRLSSTGPRFEYVLYDKIADPQSSGPRRLAHFVESVNTVATSTRRGALRRTTIDAASGSLIWLYAAQCESPPRIHRVGGAEPETMHVNEPRQAAGVVCEVTQRGAPLLIRASGASPDARWTLVKTDAGYGLLLVMPTSDGGAKVTLSTLLPMDESPEMLSKAIEEDLAQHDVPSNDAQPPNVEASK